MDDHNDNPFDFPHAWIQEETLSDIRLDAIQQADAERIGCAVFADACKAYSLAVAKQSREWHAVPAVADEGSVVVTETKMSSRAGTTQPGLATPNVLSVANGPDWCLALVLAGDGFRIVRLP